MVAAGGRREGIEAPCAACFVQPAGLVNTLIVYSVGFSWSMCLCLLFVRESLWGQLLRDAARCWSQLGGFGLGAEQQFDPLVSCDSHPALNSSAWKQALPPLSQQLTVMTYGLS